MSGQTGHTPVKNKRNLKPIHDMTPRHHNLPPKATVESCRSGDLAERGKQTTSLWGRGGLTAAVAVGRSIRSLTFPVRKAGKRA
jgi:hypothetical protein